MMERQVGHAVRLVDDLLDVSRISAGKIQLKHEWVTVAALVESAVEANRSAVAVGKLELQVHLERSDRLLKVDPTRLSQVVSNILHDATKGTLEGGKITLRTEYVARA